MTASSLATQGRRTSVATAFALASLLAWLCLALGRSGLWRQPPHLGPAERPAPQPWPAVVAVVPARNEADLIATTLRSLLEQDYPGTLAIVLVDDHSDDGTRQLAQRSALGAWRPVEIVSAPPLPAGWSGKLWAVEQGVRLAGQRWPEATYLLLTDADIAHASDNLARLVGKAERERLDLGSLMVQLRCASFWERLLAPAFVFFFQMLYPFAAVNQAGRRAAAAAGGCMLVRRGALVQAGGIGMIRGYLIDDVALARAIKHRPGGGRIWLGLGDSARSLRRYDRLGTFWAMVARTADALSSTIRSCCSRRPWSR